MFTYLTTSFSPYRLEYFINNPEVNLVSAVSMCAGVEGVAAGAEWGCEGGADPGSTTASTSTICNNNNNSSNNRPGLKQPLLGKMG